MKKNCYRNLSNGLGACLSRTGDAITLDWMAANDALISSVHVAGAEFSSTAGILPEVCGKGVVQLRVPF